MEGKRRYNEMVPQQSIFKEVTRVEGKRGIGWFQYRKEVLIPKLNMTNIEKPQEYHPDKEVPLVEDNARGAYKSKRIHGRAFTRKHQILKAPTTYSQFAGSTCG